MEKPAERNRRRGAPLDGVVAPLDGDSSLGRQAPALARSVCCRMLHSLAIQTRTKFSYHGKTTVFLVPSLFKSHDRQPTGRMIGVALLLLNGWGRLVRSVQIFAALLDSLFRSI